MGPKGQSVWLQHVCSLIVVCSHLDAGVCLLVSLVCSFRFFLLVRWLACPFVCLCGLSAWLGCWLRRESSSLEAGEARASMRVK